MLNTNAFLRPTVFWVNDKILANRSNRVRISVGLNGGMPVFYRCIIAEGFPVLISSR